MNLGHRLACVERDRYHAAIVWLADELERWTTADDRAVAVEACDDDNLRDVLRDVMFPGLHPAGAGLADGGLIAPAHPAAGAVLPVGNFAEEVA